MFPHRRGEGGAGFVADGEGERADGRTDGRTDGGMRRKTKVSHGNRHARAARLNTTCNDEGDSRVGNETTY